MWLSTNKYKQLTETIEDIPKYMEKSNREILIDTVTPQIADTIDRLIRFWNIVDEDMGLVINEREAIKIYINSIGGSIEAAFTIMNSIKISKTPIYTFNIGVVEKESFLIYLAGHKRYAYPNSIFMYTDNIINNPIEEENESTFYSKNALTAILKQNIKMCFLDRVSITEAQYDKHCKNEWWFSADDALKLHITNEISRNHYHYIKKKD